MTALEAEVVDSSAGAVAAVALSHLSLELGHLYFEDFAAGPDRLVDLARSLAPWASFATQLWRERVAPRTPRISTCFLIDDYFAAFASPREVVPMVVDAFAKAEVRLDYIARESACAEVDGLAIASMVVDRLIVDPVPGTTGLRPPVHDSGWLANGRRSPGTEVGEAMRPTNWQPPAENSANPHSIFLDVQLWDETPQGRRWSCPMLSAVWQLLRLGALRHDGRPLVTPARWSGAAPTTWAQLPPVIQLDPQAPPFAAYTTLSVLGSHFIPVEHAVRTILGQLDVSAVVLGQIRDRAQREGLALAPSIADRVDYAFVGPSSRSVASQ